METTFAFLCGFLLSKIDPLSAVVVLAGCCCKPNVACTCIFNMKVNHYPRSLQITKSAERKTEQKWKKRC